MSLTPVDKAAFAQLAQSQGSSRSATAALCFLSWDIVITTDAEVTYMWSTPWSWSKLLYFITRYYSLIALGILNRHKMTCLEWLVFEGFSALALEIVVDLILILRLYAMYTASKKVLRSVVAAFSICVIIMATSLGVSIPKIMISPQCIEAVLPIYMIVYTTVSILCEGFLFVLAMLKFYDSKRDGWGGNTLLTVLVRDSAWAFGVLFIAMIANMVLFTLGPRTLAAMGFPWLLALLGFIARPSPLP